MSSQIQSVRINSRNRHLVPGVRVPSPFFNRGLSMVEFVHEGDQTHEKGQTYALNRR